MRNYSNNACDTYTHHRTPHIIQMESSWFCNLHATVAVLRTCRRPSYTLSVSFWPPLEKSARSLKNKFLINFLLHLALYSMWTTFINPFDWRFHMAAFRCQTLLISSHTVFYCLPPYLYPLRPFDLNFDSPRGDTHTVHAATRGAGDDMTKPSSILLLEYFSLSSEQESISNMAMPSIK